MDRFARLWLILVLLASANFFAPSGAWGQSPPQPDGASLFPSVSSDGRYMAFSSEASTLVASDRNGTWDVFVRDRLAGVTDRVSVTSLGGQANGPSIWPSISGDGTRVAFASYASNLVDGDTNGTWDVFAHDFPTGLTVRASVDSEGNQAPGASAFPTLSADGRHVAFVSEAASGVAGRGEIFVHDLATEATALVSLPASEGTRPNGRSEHPSISADGRYVAFASEASNLVKEGNGASDVFVYDRASGATELSSVDSSEAQRPGHNSVPAISADGRYVAFQSLASFDRWDRNGGWDNYLWTG
ncbi:MAG: TolB family protein [Actinomycetota bacterium]